MMIIDEQSFMEALNL